MSEGGEADRLEGQFDALGNGAARQEHLAP